LFPDEEEEHQKLIGKKIFLRHVGVTKKKQSRIGYLLQSAAILMHRVSPDRMKKIGETIPSVAIVTADEDKLIKKEKSPTIKEAIPTAEFVEWKNTGHCIQVQRLREFNALVERTIWRSSSANSWGDSSPSPAVPPTHCRSPSVH
jgi:hypothetical protein